MSRNPDRQTEFRFKRFTVSNRQSAMKISTDGVLLGSWCTVHHGGTALDIGCGTGLIALMVAQRGMSDITAIEIDSLAASEARNNFAGSPWSENFTLIEGDFMNAPFGTQRYDLIVSNPPYFNNGIVSADHARATARHESSLTYGTLIAKAASMLTPEGRLALISPADRHDEIEFQAAISHLNLLRRTDVSTVAGRKPSRILWEFGHITDHPLFSDLSIRDQQGRYSEDYRCLTYDFYLNI